MSLPSRRLSIRSVPSPPPPLTDIVTSPDSDKWFRDAPITANDLMEASLVSVDGNSSVEKACEVLLSREVSFLAIGESADSKSHNGLFDWNDVNSFLVVAVKSNNMRPDETEHPRVAAIINAAKEGEVPVRLASDLSEKNPMQTLPPDASLLALLALFSRGARRVVITTPSQTAGESLGVVSDRALLSWLMEHANTNAVLKTALSSPLSSFGEGYTSEDSLHGPSPLGPGLSTGISLFSSYTPFGIKEVISLLSTDTILDAMTLMSEEGVSSVAVVDHDSGLLSSVVSVTDIGKLVLPSQSRRVLSTPLHDFITQIKAPGGSEDGVDKYPVYSVSSSSTLAFTMQKLLATNAHRVFITDDSIPSPSPPGSGGVGSNVRGVVSVVDVLSIFARYAGIPDVDPARIHRHRRRKSSSASSSNSRSSSYSRSESGSLRTRSSYSSVSAPLPIPHSGVGLGLGNTNVPPGPSLTGGMPSPRIIPGALSVSPLPVSGASPITAVSPLGNSPLDNILRTGSPIIPTVPLSPARNTVPLSPSRNSIPLAPSRRSFTQIPGVSGAGYIVPGAGMAPRDKRTSFGSTGAERRNFG